MLPYASSLAFQQIKLDDIALHMHVGALPMDVSDKAPLYWHAPSADDLLSTARDVFASSIDRPLNDAANAGTAVPPSAYNIARSYRASLPVGCCLLFLLRARVV